MRGSGYKPKVSYSVWKTEQQRFLSRFEWLPIGVRSVMEKRALLIVDHGSRISEANDMLPQLAALLRKESDFSVVFHAHMELAEPNIEQAFDACVSAGAQEVIVVPYFLSPGRHSTHDIPMMVAKAAAKHPKVSFLVTEPLGLHRKIGEVIIERVMESLASQNRKED